MSEKPRGWLGSVFQRRYREVTPAAIIFGILIGVVMNAAITYSGLKIGFTLGGSAIAAVLGWGVLRGVLRKGSIVENNIAQTVASSVNTSNSGVIFTVPVLFLLGVEFDWVWLAAACCAGAVLGVAFIIPTRKQMIDFDRLRFPTGTAVAAVLKSPGEGVKKSLVLLAGVLFAMIVIFFTQSEAVLGIPGFEALGISGVDADTVDVGSWIAAIPGLGNLWQPSMSFVWAIAPFALGAGFITGRPGLLVLAGGVLAYLIITPIAFSAGWMPPDVAAEGAAGWARGNMNRQIGIGMLMGGAFIGLLFAMPAIRAAMSSMRTKKGAGEERAELPLGVLYVAVPLAFLVLFAGSFATLEEPSIVRALLIAGIGTAWIWFSGIVIAQCTGMTDWSPISGMALLTVMICLLLTQNQVVAAVLVGAAVCVAITLSADMMQDLKTGFLVGAQPIRQQFLELCVVWIGPLVCLAVIWLLAERNLAEFGVAFGAETGEPAPQAQALHAGIDGIRGGDAPIHLYGMGGLMGALLSLSGIAGLGVLVGLSMYLPLAYLLPYGLGCIGQMIFARVKGTVWTESWGVPFAAGMLVGDGLLGVIFAAIQVFGGGS